ncbi:MAG: universal stress protein [Deinococcus-Thermus bacterium]|jgi:nucleotide-binding universal stress UspA family protein|nr:universal stress protein [Deinococcota bacterium]
MSSVVLACIDGSVYTSTVADHAAWAAARLGAPVEVLEVLGRREVSSTDRSGRIVPAARRQLLEQLAEVDAERAKLLHKQGWLDLEEAEARIRAAGVEEVTTLLRHGDLLETLAEREADAQLVVIGKRGEAADFAKLHLGSNLERIVRTSRRPILIATRNYRPIRRVLIAFDGRTSAMKAVDDISRSPLYAGLTCELLFAGTPDEDQRRKLEAAATQLRAGGLAAEIRVEPGEPAAVIGGAVEEGGDQMLVMGAYAHSRLRSLVIGSTTTELIRSCKLAIMIYR